MCIYPHSIYNANAAVIWQVELYVRTCSARWKALWLNLNGLRINVLFTDVVQRLTNQCLICLACTKTQLCKGLEPFRFFILCRENGEIGSEKYSYEQTCMHTDEPLSKMLNRYISQVLCQVFGWFFSPFLKSFRLADTAHLLPVFVLHLSILFLKSTQHTVEYIVTLGITLLVQKYYFMPV